MQMLLFRQSLDENIDDSIGADRSSHPSVRGMDVENFIYGLTYVESVVLLFSAMGYSQDEIKGIMQFKSSGSMHRVMKKLRTKHAMEEF